MVEILLDYYVYLLCYLSLKAKNVVKFCVHISPIFSCRVVCKGHSRKYIASVRLNIGNGANCAVLAKTAVYIYTDLHIILY